MSSSETEYYKERINHMSKVVATFYRMATYKNKTLLSIKLKKFKELSSMAESLEQEAITVEKENKEFAVKGDNPQSSSIID